MISKNKGKKDIVRIKLALKQDKSTISEEDAVTQMKSALDDLIRYGAFKGDAEDILVDYDVIIGPSNYIIMDIRKDAYIDAAPLSSVGAEKISTLDIPSGKSVLESNRTFSQASIKDRLKLTKMDPKMRFKYTVVDYRRFYAMFKSKLAENPQELKMLRDMFLQDLTGMMTNIVPYIQDGQQLGMILGVQSVSPNISKVARELSLAYKKAIVSTEKQGAPAPMIYKLLASKYREFVNELLGSVFPGMQDIIVNASGKVVDKSGDTKITENPAKTFSKPGRTFSKFK